MDKIWYRNPSQSEVIGRCDGDEKTEWPHRTDKSRTLKKQRLKKGGLFIDTTMLLCLSQARWTNKLTCTV